MKVKSLAGSRLDLPTQPRINLSHKREDKLEYAQRAEDMPRVQHKIGPLHQDFSSKLSESAPSEMTQDKYLLHLFYLAA